MGLRKVGKKNDGGLEEFGEESINGRIREHQDFLQLLVEYMYIEKHSV